VVVNRGREAPSVKSDNRVSWLPCCMNGFDDADAGYDATNTNDGAYGDGDDGDDDVDTMVMKMMLVMSMVMTVMIRVMLLQILMVWKTMFMMLLILMMILRGHTSDNRTKMKAFGISLR
jgi:hypothetical protein